MYIAWNFEDRITRDVGCLVQVEGAHETGLCYNMILMRCRKRSYVCTCHEMGSSYGFDAVTSKSGATYVSLCIGRSYQPSVIAANRNCDSRRCILVYIDHLTKGHSHNIHTLAFLNPYHILPSDRKTESPPFLQPACLTSCLQVR